MSEKPEMPSPFESAQLNLRLYALRRERTLREARAWFNVEFNPGTSAELLETASGPRNAFFRMVLGYWEMAASLVTTGAVDLEAFRAAHGEILTTFSKVQPFLEDLRAAVGEPEYCRHLEAVVAQWPDAARLMTQRRARAIARARAAAAAKAERA